jgi:hypothetical protein
MPGESFVNVTEGSGKKLHTFQRTIGANNVEDEIVLIGEPNLATYIVPFTASVATANAHLIQVMAGASLNLYVRRIYVAQGTFSSTSGSNFVIIRLTTAGTGGGAVTIAARDTADTPGATAMTLPTVKGTEGAALEGINIIFGAAATTFAVPPTADFRFESRGKALRIPAGVANGFALKSTNACAGNVVTGWVEFSEANF